MIRELAYGTNRAFFYQVNTAASPEIIWQLWTDPTTWKNWDAEIKEAFLDSKMKLGSKGSLTPSSGLEAKFEVIEYEKMQYYAFVTKLPAATLTVKRSFVQIQPVVFRHDVFFSGTLAWLWSFLLGNKFRRALPHAMEKLAILALETKR